MADSQHHNGIPIRATLLNRILTVLAVELFRSSRVLGCTYMLPFGIVVKTSPLTRLIEANTIEFVRENTTLPVPRVYCAFTRKKATYIVMRKMKGQWIGKDWDRRSQASKAELLAHLKINIQVERRNFGRSACSDTTFAIFHTAYIH